MEKGGRTRKSDELQKVRSNWQTVLERSGRTILKIAAAVLLHLLTTDFSPVLGKKNPVLLIETIPPQVCQNWPVILKL